MSAAQALASLPRCPGCDEAVFDGFACFECCQARAHSVANFGRCVCPARRRRPVEMTYHGRVVMTCARCLGVVPK